MSSDSISSKNTSALNILEEQFEDRMISMQ